MSEGEPGRAWARKISGLSPPEVRPHQLADDLVRLPEDLAIAFLRDVQEDLVCGSEDAAAFMMALQEALAAQLVPYDRLALLYTAAVDVGAESVQRLLLAPRARRKDTVHVPPRRAEGQDTLGMRTWKARTSHGAELDKLIMDVDPRVVRNLLINPRVTERDVLRMVNRRPVPAEVIREIASSGRWNRRHPVRRALVFNPYAPVELALRFLPFMRSPDLRTLSRDGTVHVEVATQAAQYLRVRPPGVEPDPDDDAENDDLERLRTR